MSNPPRPFTAERQLRSRMARQDGLPADGSDQVLTYLEEMDQRMTRAINGMAQLANVNGADWDLEEEEPAAAEESEGPATPVEIPATDERVAQTLQEIGRLRRRGEDDRDQLANAARELDAVVSSTEQATFAIIAAAETVEKVLDDLIGASGKNPVLTELLFEAQGHLAEIYQASGFQDLSGQRINKVVRTLQFVDERIARLEDIWSNTDSASVHLEDEAQVDDESHLLNGPQMESEALSQDDIDAMFD